ncbi:hypothetical protein [Bernardetia sp. MNP-M8]|uniref:hypothetical protein n=1 Tax=Bernardetia sp. MNP-M8 TaxID=3127470 RepID=UPI0030CDBBD3
MENLQKTVYFSTREGLQAITHIDYAIDAVTKKRDIFIEENTDKIAKVIEENITTEIYNNTILIIILKLSYYPK